MKGWLIGIAICVVVIVAGFFFWWPKAPQPAATTTPISTESASQSQYTVYTVPNSAATSTPGGFAAAFYVWYLNGLDQNTDFSRTNTFSSAMSQWLAPGFASQFFILASSTDQDPVLLAQDHEPSWLSNINTSILNQTTKAAEVIVSLGTADQLQKLDVMLTNSDQGWRIESVRQAI